MISEKGNREFPKAKSDDHKGKDNTEVIKMKKTPANTGSGYVFLNILLAIASFLTAYALYTSAANENKWYPGAMVLLLLIPSKDVLSKKHQKAAYIAAGIAAAAAAVFVFSQVGMWILNIRYSAAVFNSAIGVMALMQIIMYAVERKYRDIRK